MLTALLLGCASEAPPLPPDTTSINRTRDLTLEDFTPEARTMTCDQIAAERREVTAAMQDAKNKIAGNRSHNETVVGAYTAIGVATGFIGLVAGAPVLAASDRNLEEKDAITALYRRQDTLIKLAALKQCPSSP